MEQTEAPAWETSNVVWASMASDDLHGLTTIFSASTAFALSFIYQRKIEPNFMNNRLFKLKKILWMKENVNSIRWEMWKQINGSRGQEI